MYFIKQYSDSHRNKETVKKFDNIEKALKFWSVCAKSIFNQRRMLTKDTKYSTTTGCNEIKKWVNRHAIFDVKADTESFSKNRCR